MASVKPLVSPSARCFEQRRGLLESAPPRRPVGERFGSGSADLARLAGHLFQDRPNLLSFS
ncbi:hypothetical protein CSC36_6601 [Pseudomonas aeruginosa]|nr:hypothetical protein CSC36_6601 [Pseudomonas aeruginosa]